MRCVRVSYRAQPVSALQEVNAVLFLAGVVTFTRDLEAFGEFYTYTIEVVVCIGVVVFFSLLCCCVLVCFV